MPRWSWFSSGEPKELGRFGLIGIGMIALPAAIMASGFAENIRSRKQQYNFQAHLFLDDGIIDEVELAQLEELRLDSDQALQLLQEMMQKIDDKKTTKCPHCGAAID